MTTEIMVVIEFTIAIFVFGVTVGKMLEKIERLIHKLDSTKDHKNTNKNDRR